MKKVDWDIAEHNRILDEMQHRTEVENEAFELMAQGKFVEAKELVETLDDSLLEFREWTGEEAEEWKEKEIYYDEEGKVKIETFSKGKIENCAMKIPIKVEVRVGEDRLDNLEEIAKKVDKLRNGHPLTETHFIIDLT